MLFIHLYDITKAIKTIRINEIKVFIFEKYYKQIDLLFLASKLIKNISDPRNAKEHYQSLIITKNQKSVKQSEIITYQPKTFQNPNIVDIKSVITEHAKTSHKLSKTIRKAEKVSSNSSLYSDTKKSEKILNEKNVKRAKGAHAFKGYASSYNAKISIFFNPELELKDAESANKSKLIELLTQLKGFKSVTTLVLVFKKLEIKDKTKYDNFYSGSKAEIIINESDIGNVFPPIFTTIIEKL